jgi:DNA-directed RNA polymerase subunit RPC12/RpoP
MFKFFCAVCVDDKDLYASSLDSSYAYANCPDCGILLKEVFARHEGITDEDMTTESYKSLNGLDNDTP